MLINETGPIRYYSDECWLGYETACTGVANPQAPPKHRMACHGATHVATW